MEQQMKSAEKLVREFLVLRGFTNTLQAYDTELLTHTVKGFQVDKILDLIFSVYVPNFQADRLVAFLGFFKNSLTSYSSSETTLVSTFSQLETSLLRFYVVHAVQSNRNDKVVEFFSVNGPDLLQSSQEDRTRWREIANIKNPHLEPEFRLFFSKEWYQDMYNSVRIFFRAVFSDTDRVPAILKICSERDAANVIKIENIHLNRRVSELRALLNDREAQLWRYKSEESGDSSSKLA